MPKTTAQVNTLLARTDVIPHELDVTALLDPARRDAEIAAAVEAVDAALAAEKDVVLYTSRDAADR